MDLEKLIAAARAALADLLAKRQEKTEALAQMRAALDGDGATVTEEQVRAAVADRDALDPQIEAARERVVELEAEKARDDAAAALAARVAPVGQPAERTSGTYVVSEPEVYRRGGERSYFRDLWLASGYGRRDAIERLHRNDAMVAEAIRRDAQVAMQMRAIGTADGSGGEFVPPLWLVSEFEKLARDGRVVANRVNNRPLPAGTDSISVPKVTGGTTVAEQTTQGNALSETDLQTGSATAAVTTVGGVQTVNLQLVEQSPINIDDVVLQDLAEDYAEQVDVFVITANGTNKKGLLNCGGNAITYTDASPTVPEAWPKLVDAKRQVGTNRKKPATEIFVTPTRWAWFEAALDANNRPFVSDNLATAIPLLGTDEGQTYEGLVGTLRGLSLPVFADGNIPANLGAGTNEDRIIVIRPSDFTLYEGARQAEAFRATKAKEAQVVFRLYAYVAFMSEKAPKGVSVISGTGLIQPTF